MSSVARRPIAPALLESGVVAVLRGAGPDRLADVCRTLAQAGVSCLELTMTTPGAVAALAELRGALPSGAVLGMGSVTEAEQARAAVRAGAEFLVSPGVCPEVARFAVQAEVAVYPGAWTPSEVLSAWELGAAAVKLFPADLGGPAHLRHLAGPLPDIPLVPTGGIVLDQVADYIAAGAAAIGLGTPLVGDALAGGSLPALAERAGAALRAVQEGRRRRAPRLV